MTLGITVADTAIFAFRIGRSWGAIGVGVVHNDKIGFRIGFCRRSSIHAHQETNGCNQVDVLAKELLDVGLIVRLLFGFEIRALHT